MNAGPALTGRAARIVLAMGAAAREHAGLDIARCLAGERLEELLGLIVEDAGVLGHAQSRLAREIVASGSERPLETAALARQLRAQAEAARRRFESEAARLGLKFRSEVARGEVLDELTRRCAEAETLIVSGVLEAARSGTDWRLVLHRLSGSATRSVLLARQGWLTGGPVLVVANDEASVARLIPAARVLADASRSPLRLLMTVGGGAAAGDVHKRVAPAPDALRGLPPGSVHLTRPEALTAAARRERPRLIVVAWNERDEDSARLADLVAATRSAILLVR